MPFAFSVSETKKIYFSQGNLQYKASTKTWRFAPKQWDYVGGYNYGNTEVSYGTIYENGEKSDNSHIGGSYSGWIDLFSWGTSGWNSGALAYLPYDYTHRKNSDYYPGGDYTNNLTGLYANADWGVYNAIYNGGNQAGMWRTLTRDEWTYLIKSRTNATSKKGVAIVNNVQGLVLLPDDWILPNDLTFTSSDIDSESKNIFSVEDWAKMEVNGAVFLPAAGDRLGKDALYGVGSGGFYWSSSNCNNCRNIDDAWCFSFTPYYYYGYFVMQNERVYGHSVRLVRDVE